MPGLTLRRTAVLDDTRQLSGILTKVFKLVIILVSVRNVPVSLVVHRHYVHGDVILLMGIQTCDFYSHSGKHPPEGRTNTSDEVIFFIWTF